MLLGFGVDGGELGVEVGDFLEVETHGFYTFGGH